MIGFHHGLNLQLSWLRRDRTTGLRSWPALHHGAAHTRQCAAGLPTNRECSENETNEARLDRRLNFDRKAEVVQGPGGRSLCCGRCRGWWVYIAGVIPLRLTSTAAACPWSKLWKHRESANFLEPCPYPRMAWLRSCSLSSPSSRSVFEAERHWSSSVSHAYGPTPRSSSCG